MEYIIFVRAGFASVHFADIHGNRKDCSYNRIVQLRVMIKVPDRK